MASPSNHWKLGLFVVCGIALSLSTIVVLGARTLQKDTVQYRSFFDESVQGLDVGSPVKFRGVTVGNVADIKVGPDRRHVEVLAAFEVDAINRLGLGTGKGPGLRIHVPPDLRIQLASAGITGVKFLELDFFDIKDNPPPTLPFPTPDNYIPVAVSTLKNLEEAVVHAVDRLPELTDASLRVLDRLDRLLLQVETDKLPERLLGVMNTADHLMADLGTGLHRLDAPGLSASARQTIDNLNVTVNRFNALVARVDGDKGLLVSAQRASDAFGNVATDAHDWGNDIQQTLSDIRQAAQSVHQLADALDTDSDMLLKGRAKRNH